MALTIRNVGTIRPVLDRYKLENDIATDTKAIEKLLLSYYSILEDARQFSKDIIELERDIDYHKDIQRNLSLALKPFSM